ncbi:MAG TPA: DUF1501 domain-containing protein, partial [Myxococcaceae bacterium]|nr:DUF1501 domain-containing protein [Myxococcaceae bacterium]
LLGGMSFRAFAQAANLAPTDRCFIFAYFQGGWDQLLGLDPRDPTVFTPDRLSETRILPAYDLIADASYPIMPVTPATRPGAEPSRISFGPAIGRLAEHYDLMAVIRGINMTTLAHEEGYRYFLTGKHPIAGAARGSSAATEIVGQMKPAVPIPSVAYNIESYNDRHPGSANALRVSRSNDLLLTLSPSPTALDSELEKQLVDFRGQPITCDQAAYDSRGLTSSYRGSRDQMQLVLSQRLDTAFRFERPENAAVRAAYGLPTSGPYDMSAGRAALAATALKRGISQCVSITITGGLDTHFGPQRTQADNQRAGWNALGDLVTDLRSSPHPAGGNFMDHTTLMVFSEFSRTPMLNSTSGRDHHLSSSCLLMGAGIKHNVVFGKSGDVGMSPGVVDHKTGLPDPSGRNIFPEDVIATVLASAGLDYSPTRTEPIRALLT